MNAPQRCKFPCAIEVRIEAIASLRVIDPPMIRLPFRSFDELSSEIIIELVTAIRQTIKIPRANISIKYEEKPKRYESPFQKFDFYKLLVILSAIAIIFWEVAKYENAMLSSLIQKNCFIDTKFILRKISALFVHNFFAHKSQIFI